MIVAAAFLAIGIAWFVPGLTVHLDKLQRRDQHSHAQLFGVFDVSVVHNLLHLAFGVAGLILVRTYARSRAYLLVGGPFYLTLWLYGMLNNSPDSALPLNNADHWLHFDVGLVMVVLALTPAASKVPTGTEGEILVPDRPQASDSAIPSRMSCSLTTSSSTPARCPSA